MKNNIFSKSFKTGRQIVLLLAILSFNFSLGNAQNALAQSSSYAPDVSSLQTDDINGAVAIYRAPKAIFVNNDDFATPIEITGIPYENNIDTTHATVSDDDPPRSANHSKCWRI